MALLALRPSVVASVLLHAGAFVGVAAWAGGDRAGSRDAVVLHFEALDVGAALDAPDAPRPDPLERDVEPVLVEPPTLEPVVAEPPVPEEPTPVVEELPADTPGPGPAAPPSPTARTRASRPSPAPAAPPPAGAPAAAPTLAAAPAVPAPASVASRAGAPRVSALATASPTNRRPSYPAEALRNGWTGVVWLVVDIGADGTVSRVTLERSSGHAVLDAAATEAVWGWRYAPRLEDGVPVGDRIRFPVRFDTR